MSATAGKPKKIVYRARNEVLAMNAFKFGQWTKNDDHLEETDYFVFRRKIKKKKFWLEIKSVHIRDEGLYSFRVNDTVVGQWQLQVKGNCKGFVIEYIIYVSQPVSWSVRKVFI